MIWSVSMLSPNFQAFPRTVLGSVTGASPRRPALPGDRPDPRNAMTSPAQGAVSAGGACPPCASCRRTSTPVRGRSSEGSSDLGRHLGENFAWVSDLTPHRAGRRHRRVGQIDLRLRVAHTAWEVAVCGAQADLALAEHAHVPTQA